MFREHETLFTYTNISLVTLFNDCVSLIEADRALLKTTRSSAAADAETKLLRVIKKGGEGRDDFGQKNCSGCA